MRTNTARRDPFVVVAEALSLGLEVSLRVTMESRPVRLNSQGQLQVRSATGWRNGLAPGHGVAVEHWWSLERPVEWLVQEARHLDVEDLAILEKRIVDRKGARHG